jgi:hypothetical protein
MPDIDNNVIFYFLPEALEVVWRYYDYVVVVVNNLHPHFLYLLKNQCCGRVQAGWNIVGTHYDCFGQGFVR